MAEGREATPKDDIEVAMTASMTGRETTAEKCPWCKRVVPLAWREDFFSGRTNCGYCGVYLVPSARDAT